LLAKPAKVLTWWKQDFSLGEKRNMAYKTGVKLNVVDNNKRTGIKEPK
jgi:hypothetical protein